MWHPALKTIISYSKSGDRVQAPHENVAGLSINLVYQSDLSRLSLSPKPRCLQLIGAELPGLKTTTP